MDKKNLLKISLYIFIGIIIGVSSVAIINYTFCAYQPILISPKFKIIVNALKTRQIFLQHEYNTKNDYDDTTVTGKKRIQEKLGRGIIRVGRILYILANTFEEYRLFDWQVDDNIVIEDMSDSTMARLEGYTLKIMNIDKNSTLKFTYTYQ